MKWFMEIHKCRKCGKIYRVYSRMFLIARTLWADKQECGHSQWVRYDKEVEMGEGVVMIFEEKIL
jgi:hypothetical protein